MGNLNFSTPVNIKKGKSEICYNSKILMLGSCFTTEVGKIMQDYRFDVMPNPFGVLYNPASILSSIKRMASCCKFTCEDVVETNPSDKGVARKYASFFHHSSFARLTAEEFLENANDHLAKSHTFMQEADTVIITLGTAWVFRHIDKGYIVSNCHKRVAKEFQRELMTVEECSKCLQEIVALLPDKNIIFTVSPIRHFKDGAHGNQISKSTLLLAVDNITSEFSNCSYFPSYEIMMDELRDYRYYAEDMVHPSPLAIKYIFQKFSEAYISTSSIEQMEENLRLTKASNHIQK